MKNLDAEQIRADIGRWNREIQTCRTRLKLTDDHPEITRRVARIRVAERLLGVAPDCGVCDGRGCPDCDEQPQGGETVTSLRATLAQAESNDWAGWICCEHHSNRANGLPCDGACCNECPGVTAPNPSCSKCGGPLTSCVTCGKPAQCGEPWCVDCIPDGGWTATGSSAPDTQEKATE